LLDYTFSVNPKYVIASYSCSIHHFNNSTELQKVLSRHAITLHGIRTAIVIRQIFLKQLLGYFKATPGTIN